MKLCAISVHEAGHVVAALAAGYKVLGAGIAADSDDPNDPQRGVTIIETPSITWEVGHPSVRKWAKYSLGGFAGESVARTVGDLEHAPTGAAKDVGELLQELKKMGLTNDQALAEIGVIAQETCLTLAHRWDEVKLVAAALDAHRQLTGEVIDRILSISPDPAQQPIHNDQQGH